MFLPRREKHAGWTISPAVSLTQTEEGSVKRTKEIMKFHTQWPPGQAQHRRRHGARSRSAFRGQAMFQKEETPGGSSPRSWPANQRRSHRTCFRALELGDRARASVAENSHQLTRQRERLMRRFKSAEHAQRFLGTIRCRRRRFPRRAQRHRRRHSTPTVRGTTLHRARGGRHPGRFLKVRESSHS